MIEATDSLFAHALAEVPAFATGALVPFRVSIFGFRTSRISREIRAEGLVMAGEPQILADRRKAETSTGSSSLEADDLIMRNKANLPAG
jgi:hypothetical protein